MSPAPRLADAITTTRRLTTGAIGVNLFVPQPRESCAEKLRRFAAALAHESDHYGVALGQPSQNDDEWAEKLDVVCDLRPDVVSFTFGSPSRYQCGQLINAGIFTLATVTTVGEARMARAAGVDGLVAQGAEAGGHRATFDPLAEPDGEPLNGLLDKLVRRFDCPGVAAGGIATADDVRQVRCAGAAAAQVGTALLLADEAGTNPVHRAALQDPQFDRTVITRAFTGRYARTLRNRFTDEHDAEAIAGFPAVARITAPVQAAAVRAGDPHGTSLWAGTAFRLARTGSAMQIVKELAA
jgi:nitronate monooxygenase